MIGDVHSVSGSIFRDVSIHTLMWAGHFRTCRKLTRLSISILKAVGIQKCKVEHLHRFSLVIFRFVCMFAVDYIQKGPYNLILSFRIPLLGVPKVEESIF